MSEERTIWRISDIQAQAWAACNASYHEPDAEIYRAAGRALYLEDVRERIAQLFQRGDRQNRLIDQELDGDPEAA